MGVFNLKVTGSFWEKKRKEKKGTEPVGDVGGGKGANCSPLLA